MNKKIILIFLLLPVLLFSGDVVKIKDIRQNIQTMNDDDRNVYIASLKTKKIEKETGWIISTESYDDINDIVFVEMDKPGKNVSLIVPDIFFIVEKKISKRLSEFQMIYFSAVIRDYDKSRGMIEVDNIYLSGIMK